MAVCCYHTDWVMFLTPPKAEVEGSNPFGSAIFFNEIAFSDRPKIITAVITRLDAVS